MWAKWKIYKFSKKVAQDLADELGLDHVPKMIPPKRKKE